MDPSTTAHIDPSTLHQTSTGPDGVPHLGVKPTSTTTTTTSPSTGTSSSTSPQATGLRQRVNNLGTQLDHATEHPAVKNAKGAAQKQVGQLRETLGKSQTVLDLERKTGVDRVALVFGGVFAYLLLIPLNLFGLALPTTTLLTLLPPSFLALGILESKIPNEQNEAATRALLSYFVTLGFIQFLESLAAGLLERRIPQYYTVKLLFLAYLLHPRTQGAMNLHNHVFRPLLARAQEAATPVNTPPQSNKDAGYSTTSPSAKPTSPAPGSSFSNASVGFDASGNITRDQASGQNFSVVNELH